MVLASFTDGCSIPIQCSSDAIEQSKFYNGYQGDTMVNNVFCFEEVTFPFFTGKGK